MSAAAMRWIVGSDTGVSSKAIWAHMMGATPERGNGFGNYPHDPDDFSRCWHLLHCIPEWRARIHEMGSYGPEWARLVSAWDELEEMYLTACGANWPPPRVMASAMYARMQSLIDGAPAQQRGAA